MFITVFSLIFVLSFGWIANTKGNPSKNEQRYFRFFDDGCEHPVSACEQINELPKNLKKLKAFKSEKFYVGTVQIEFAEKNEAGIDAFEHYFSNAKSCKNALGKMNCESAAD